MDDREIQARRRFFHKTPVRLPISHCYDFVIYPNGLLSKFPKKSGGNEKVILYFLTRRMSVRGADKQTGDFKDIAETFWFKRETMAAETGLRPERISEALKSLVNAGILVHKVDRGIGQWIAFSEAAIREWKIYSENLMNALDDNDYDPDTETGPGRVRKPDPGEYGNRTQASTETGPGSYIEDSEKVFSTGTQWMDGGRKPSQPAKARDKRVSKVVDLSQQLERILKPKGFVDFDETNLFMAQLFDQHGEQVISDWLGWLRQFMAGRSFKKDTSWNTQLSDSWSMFNQYRPASH